jgi:hypothetical protein
VNWRRGLTLAALPLVMSAGVVGAHSALASTTGTGTPTQTCILGIICVGGGGGGSSSSASPSPTFSLPSCLATPLPTPLPTTLASLPATVLKKLKSLPQCLASALPTKLPTVPGLPTSLPTVPGLPTTLPTAATVPGLPTTLPTVPGLPGTGKSTGKPTSRDPKDKSTTAGAGLVAPAAISVITASSATLDHFTYAGTAKLPLASGGTVTMMKFTASSMTLSGAADAVTEAGHTATTSSPVMAFNGNVVLYATKLSGTLDGIDTVGLPASIPLDLTPTTIDNLPSLNGLPLKITNLLTGRGQITMTSVTTDQATGTADTLTYGPGGTGFSVVLH